MQNSAYYIGVCGDSSPTNQPSGDTLNPNWSVLTNTTGYAPTNTSADPNLASQYCNGSRTPPEFGASGCAVQPGISDCTVPSAIFNFTPVANVSLSTLSSSLVPGRTMPQNGRITPTNRAGSANPGSLTLTTTPTVTAAGLGRSVLTVAGATSVPRLAPAIFLSSVETYNSPCVFRSTL